MTRTKKTPLDSAVRYAINKHAVRTGRAPGVKTIAAMLSCSAEEIASSLDHLAESHGIVLHPGSHRIWVAHPFSFAPTAFWVVGENQSWWGNCAWCSLGIAAMIDGDVKIVTRAGAENKPIEVHIRDKSINEPELLVHFSVPMEKWWDNVHYTCGTILMFQSVQDIDAWCEKHGIEKGEILSIDQAWALAQAWYGDYLNPKWRRRTVQEALEIFEQLGLNGSFWRPGTDWK